MVALAAHRSALLAAASYLVQAHALRALSKPLTTMSAWASAASETTEATREVVTNLQAVRARVAAASAGRETTLVAVSKTKPLALIAAAASAGHRDFGENYVQELVEKASNAEEAVDDGAAREIRWHFIGRLQSNKAKLLCTTPNLHAVHTVHNEKIANALQRHWLDLRGPEAPPLNVFVQVLPAPRPRSR